MFYSLLTVGVCSATLVWYLAKPEPLKGFENIPYVLSVSAWSSTIGFIDLTLNAIMVIGWVSVASRQITYLYTKSDEYTKLEGVMLLFSVSTVMGVLGSLSSVTAVKILEANIILKNLNLLRSNSEVLKTSY